MEGWILRSRVGYVYSIPFLLLTIGNAIKYRSSEPPEIKVTARENGSGWEICVADNGIGIPAEYRKQVFGLFRRLHNQDEYPDTGIGLAICQKIVERHGGRIWVESGERKGSILCFTIPSAV